MRGESAAATEPGDDPLKLELLPAPDPALARLPPLRIGHVPAGTGTPALHLVVHRPNAEPLRADLYADTAAELYVATEATWWRGWVVVGFGHAVFFIDLDARAARAIRLPLYFQAFVASDDWLLAVSGAGLPRIGPAGEVAWENPEVAVDGVIVHDVDGRHRLGLGRVGSARRLAPVPRRPGHGRLASLITRAPGSPRRRAPPPAARTSAAAPRASGRR